MGNFPEERIVYNSIAQQRYHSYFNDAIAAEKIDLIHKEKIQRGREREREREGGCTCVGYVGMKSRSFGYGEE